jgi:3-hydroxyisobutyrate dehydrogenase
MRRIGFIGIGLMGTPMVRRLLQADFDVTVWNRTRAKVARVARAGASVAKSPQALAGTTEAVCLCLADTAAVETVVFAQRGIAAARKAPRFLIDFSSIEPAATRAMAERLKAACGTQWIDAPVSGGVRGAEQGSLIIFAGGPAKAVRSLQPLFAPLACKVTRMGEVGAGQLAKLCNQVIVANNLIAITEAMALGARYGVDVARLPAALAGGFADSLPLQIFGPRIASGQTEPKIGNLGTMLKDIETAVAAGRAANVATPLSGVAAALYRLAGLHVGLDADMAALRDLYRIGRR